MSSDFQSKLALYRTSIRKLLPKPGKDLMKEMFLSRGDLPAGDWVMAGEFIRRIGVRKNSPDEIRRAKIARGIRGRRAWRSDRTYSTIVSGISFFPTGDDAKSYLPKLMDTAIRNPFIIREDRDERRIDVEEVRDLSQFGLLYEIQYRTQREFEGALQSVAVRERYVGGTVDRVEFLLVFQALGEYWPWERLAPVVHRQADRIRLVLSDQTAAR